MELLALLFIPALIPPFPNPLLLHLFLLLLLLFIVLLLLLLLLFLGTFFFFGGICFWGGGDREQTILSYISLLSSSFFSSPFLSPFSSPFFFPFFFRFGDGGSSSHSHGPPSEFGAVGLHNLGNTFLFFFFSIFYFCQN